MAFLAAIPAAFGAVAAGTATAAQAALAMGTVATGISAVGAGVTAFSAYKQSQFQAQVAKNNALIAANNSQNALEAGQSAESASRMQTSIRVGAALAAQGANGVDVGFGSPAAVRGSLINEGELDALTVRHNAAVNALGYIQQSQSLNAEASAYQMAGTNAALGGALNVGSTLIGGASSIYGRQAALQMSGASSAPGN
jgi:hypothetical protein